MTTHDPSPNLLAIFDVDGTLLVNKRAVRDEFIGAFTDVAGATIEPGKFHFAGMTDRGIVRTMMQAAGVEEEFEDLFARFEARFAERLEQVYADHPDPHLLPGVPALLDALEARPEVALALGTGNCRSTCEIKLRRFGIWERFGAGGFGGDHEVRSKAIEAAMADAAEKLGWNGEAWVIGDTVRDIGAAREAGAKVLAVATGFEPTDVLAAAGPDALLPDLTDTARVLALLGLA